MSSYVLCLFEGVRTEINIANNFFQHFVNDEKIILKASYGCNIYNLYNKVIQDDYFDTYELILEELNKKNNLKDYERDILDIDPERISDIYLFFDYDCHCNNADDNVLLDMLTVFDDPQDKGLLCISYPMVEAIKHQKGTEFTEELHTITDLVNYKRWINANNEFSKRYSNWGLYDKCTWDEINKHHLARANLLVNNALELPSEVLTQKCIFQCQLNKHTPNSRVAVISSFPLMLYDYYGQRIFD